MKNFLRFFRGKVCNNRFFFTAIIVFTYAINSSFSQNFSGLEGKTLTKIDDIGTGLISLIGSKGLEGSIVKVSVITDSERTLKFSIEYNGFASAYLRTEVLSNTKATQNEVKGDETDLTGKTGPLTLEMTLKNNVAEGFKLESSFLQIRVSKSKTAVGGLVFLYSLNKTWQKEIKAENLILQATLEPIGITADLKEAKKVLIVPVYRPMVIQNLKKPVNTATYTQTPSVSVANKSTMMRNPKLNTQINAGTDNSRNTAEAKPNASNIQVMRVNPELIRGLSLEKSETDKGALGPDNNPIPLFEDLTVTKDFEFPYEITNISMDVYPDRNPASGIFYYLPSAYNLKWAPDDGYDFRIIYGTGTSEGSGDVRMAATLTPNISKKEIDLISRLLSSYVSRNPGMKYSKVRLIPVSENPAVSFPADLNSQYEITADKVSVTISSSLRDPFQVSWVTDNNTKDEMQVALLEKSGIQGIMSMKPQSENIPEIKIPVFITLADNRTIGRIDLENKKWRNTPWKNQSPYPLKLKYLDMLLVKDQDGKSTPFIYSWSINDVVVPSMSSVQFDASNVPTWLDDADMAQRIWVEYSVVDCDECDKTIINKITGGTYGSNIKKITFETFQVFDSIDAQFIQIKVRSKQGDPKGEKVVEFNPIRIYKDNEVAESEQLFVPLEAELSYEYMITVVMKNGNSFKADKWISSGEPEIYLGLEALRNAIPGIPKKE